jgi:hypothetical protein
VSFCFNCHQQWDGQRSVADVVAEPLLYPFTAAELARLSIYRAAIRAGFYSDR